MKKLLVGGFVLVASALAQLDFVADGQIRPGILAVLIRHAFVSGTGGRVSNRDARAWDDSPQSDQ